ncbi:hypothetical protein G9A89_014483 [Geosiphon pyriformis]|nr:hypothetical protein G9A89_014483 [Geosiphon pyriformis]
MASREVLSTPETSTLGTLGTHYRFGGKLFCPEVGGVVPELEVNLKEGVFLGFSTPTPLDDRPNEVIAIKEKFSSTNSSVSSLNLQSSKTPEAKKSRADFLVGLTSALSNSLKNNNLDPKLLQEFSQFLKKYEGLETSSRFHNVSFEINDTEMTGSIQSNLTQRPPLLVVPSIENEKNMLSGQKPQTAITVDHLHEAPRNQNNHTTIHDVAPEFECSSHSLCPTAESIPKPVEIIVIPDEDNIDFDIEIIEISDDEGEEEKTGEKRQFMEVQHKRGTKRRRSRRDQHVDPSIATSITGHPLPLFKDQSLRTLALTPRKIRPQTGENYERLEHLGDRVLQIIATEMFLKRLGYLKPPYSRNIGSYIQDLVRNSTLSVFGYILNLKKEVANVHSPYVASRLSPKDHADMIEAIIAAHYLDNNRDLTPTSIYLEQLMGSLVDEFLKAPKYGLSIISHWLGTTYPHLKDHALHSNLFKVEKTRLNLIEISRNIPEIKELNGFVQRIYGRMLNLQLDPSAKDQFRIILHAGPYQVEGQAPNLSQAARSAALEALRYFRNLEGISLQENSHMITI